MALSFIEGIVKAVSVQNDRNAAADRVPGLEAKINRLEEQIDAGRRSKDTFALAGAAQNQPGNFGAVAPQLRDPRATQFIANATSGLANRQPYENVFKTAFANPTAMPPKPVEDNPSNASTVMKDGKALYSDDNYNITADDDSNVTIFNKNTKETYKAWGDPHLDVDGKRAFDFYGKTSFKLAGGPMVTMDTVDAENNTTYTSKLTITNGGYGAQIVGIDPNTKGDLAVKEFRNQGRELDRMVDDGVVLEENQDMTVNDGRGFVVSDANGLKRQVDQSYIDSVDLKKTQGQSSQNVNQFEDVPARRYEPQPMMSRYESPQRYEPEAEYEQPSYKEAYAPRYKRTESSGTDRFKALRELMNWCKPTWNESFKSLKPFEPARADRGREQERTRESDRSDDMSARPPKRVNVNVDVRGLMNDKVKVAVDFYNAATANMRLQVWGG
jgi:Domain of Unknown Function (DUF1521)